MGLEQTTPAALRKEKDPVMEKARRDYEEKKREVEELLAEIHEFEQKSGIKNKFDQAA